MRKRIVITTAFSALHSWPECNVIGKEYLRNDHRHRFTVTLKFNVEGNNREIEFIKKKEEVEDLIRERFERRNLGRASCEDICIWLMEKQPNACFCSVFEDNENGAEVEQ